jgi:Family of unknown function (DUF5990)
MPQLPDRPDTDQLRRQARELHRAAQGGDAGALRRLRRVSDKVTLSAAQLALARDYGFPSWRRLRDEVEHRRSLLDQPERDAAGPVPLPPARSWREVREWSAELLRSHTGEDVAAWNGRVAATGLGDEQSVRGWLAEQGVTGYAQALLVWERFGYPDFIAADANELVDGQYADRPQLRPILDAVLVAASALGPVTAPARKTCVSLVSPRRTFAAVQATTKSRVDLGLRLDLGLAWGDVPGDGTLRLFRGAKLRLVDVEPGLIAEAMRPGHRLVARIRLTDVRGNPVCARVHPPALTWLVEKCG